MKPPCARCDQPDLSLLRLVLMGELLRADEALLLHCADVMQQHGVLQLADEDALPAPTREPARQATLHVLRRSGGDAL